MGAYADQSFDGVVSFISPAVQEETRTFLIKADIDDPNDQLKSGMFATIDLILATRTKPVVAAEALVATQAGYVVYVVQDGVARRRAVDIGLRRPESVQIVRGLEEGETVVVSGQMRLSDGVKVTVAEPAQDTAASGQEAGHASETNDGGAGRETTR